MKKNILFIFIFLNLIIINNNSFGNTINLNLCQIADCNKVFYGCFHDCNKLFYDCCRDDNNSPKVNIEFESNSSVEKKENSTITKLRSLLNSPNKINDLYNFIFKDCKNNLNKQYNVIQQYIKPKQLKDNVENDSIYKLQTTMSYMQKIILDNLLGVVNQDKITIKLDESTKIIKKQKVLKKQHNFIKIIESQREIFSLQEEINTLLLEMTNSKLDKSELNYGLIDNTQLILYNAQE